MVVVVVLLAVVVVVVVVVVVFVACGRARFATVEGAALDEEGHVAELAAVGHGPEPGPEPGQGRARAVGAGLGHGRGGVRIQDEHVAQVLGPCTAHAGRG